MPNVTPLKFGPMLPAQAFATVRRRMVLDYCKWDPQVEDVSALGRAALLLQRDAWDQLSRWSKQLYLETLAAEQELVRRPDLIGELGLPRAIIRLLRSATRQRPSPGMARVMRFDFHWTTDGWRISEVNSDVPGGFIEASPFTQMMADETECGLPGGDPAAIGDAEHGQRVPTGRRDRIGQRHA